MGPPSGTESPSHFREITILSLTFSFFPCNHEIVSKIKVGLMDQTRIYLIFAPFALLLSLVCLVFTLVNLRKNRFLSLLAFLACIFSIILCTILEILASTPDLVLLFSHFSYTFIAILPVSWFLFCIEYTNGPHTRLLRWYSVLLLSIIPALTACLAWTTESHALIW